MALCVLCWGWYNETIKIAAERGCAVMDVELKYGFQPADFQPANLELARRMLEGHHQALRALMKQPDSRAKDLQARHLLSVIDALDWYVTNYDAIRRQFNSGKIATLFTSHRGDGP